MNGAEALLQTLTANGVDLCFMNPGTSEMQFVAALDRTPELRGVLCLFEGVCSGAADGYARMTGRPASTLLHLGPGLANGLANFHNARKALSPIVSIVGEHSTAHLKYDAPLTSDLHAFARTVSSSVHRPRCASEVALKAAEAIESAYGPPGQISMLVVPADLSWTDAGDAKVPTIKRPKPASVDPEKLTSAAELLRSGERTALLLSGSALLKKGLEAAGRLSASTGVRVFANRNAARMQSGRDCFHPQRIAYFPEPAEAMLAGLETLILVEAKPPVSFFGYPTGRSWLAPEHCRIQELAGREEDGAEALEELAAILRCPSEYPVSDTRARMAPPQGGNLTAELLGQAIGALLPEGAIVCDEMISSGEAIWPYLVHAAPHDHLPVTGGSIGQGLPLAVGVALACPDRKVVALEADGSAMYTLQSLWTMAREALDVTTVILANRRYRILDVEMRRTGAQGFGPAANAMIDIGQPGLDWVCLANGVGVRASRAETADQFVHQFRTALSEKGPHLIEAVLPSV